MGNSKSSRRKKEDQKTEEKTKEMGPFVLRKNEQPMSLMILGDYGGDLRYMMWYKNVSQEDEEEKPWWYFLCYMPYRPRLPVESCCLTLGRYIYIFGGLQPPYSYYFWKWKFWVREEPVLVVTNALYRYDVHRQRIERMADLNVGRKECTAVVMNHAIYVVGGMTEKGELIDTIERYAIEMDEWTILGTRLPEPRAAAAVCAYKNEMHIIGGIVDNGGKMEPTSSCLTLDPISEDLREYSPMPVELAYSAAAIYEEKVVVVGGVNQLSPQHLHEGVQKTSKTLVYNFETEEWSDGPPLNTPRCKTVLIPVGCAIYCFGGIGNDDTMSRAVELQFKESSTWIADADAAIPVCGQRVPLLPNIYIPWIDR